MSIEQLFACRGNAAAECDSEPCLKLSGFHNVCSGIQCKGPFWIWFQLQRTSFSQLPDQNSAKVFRQLYENGCRPQEAHQDRLAEEYLQHVRGALCCPSAGILKKGKISRNASGSFDLRCVQPRTKLALRHSTKLSHSASSSGSMRTHCTEFQFGTRESQT